MAARFSELVEYFEKIAGEHKEILHSSAEKHFYRFELDEVLTGMCSEMNYPALILEGYTIDYSDSDSDNIQKRRGGGFILLDKVDDSKDFDAIHDLYDRLESIAEDILIRMRRDKQSRAVSVIRGFEISNVNGALLSVEELGQHGLRFSFEIVSGVNSEMNERKWL